MSNDLFDAWPGARFEAKRYGLSNNKIEVIAISADDGQPVDIDPYVFWKVIEGAHLGEHGYTKYSELMKKYEPATDHNHNVHESKTLYVGFCTEGKCQFFHKDEKTQNVFRCSLSSDSVVCNQRTEAAEILFSRCKLVEHFGSALIRFGEPKPLESPEK